MNIKECKDAALQHLNQYSIAGQTVALTYNNQADYVLRMLNLINDAQMEIAKTVKKIFAQYTITQMNIPNLLPDTAMEQVNYLGSDKTLEAGAAAKAYYFEVNKPATVYIEEKIGRSWNVVATINANPTAPGFTAYKGRVITTGVTRIRFSGTFPYSYRYVGLYAYTFADDASVPAARAYIEYEMPTDFFMMVGRGIPYYKGKEFILGHDYEWRGRKTLLLRRDLEGEFIIDYYRFPTRITAATPETTELDNTLDTHEAVPYYVASALCQLDNPGLSATLYNIWETRLVRLGETVQSDVTKIEDVYDFAGGIAYVTA